MYFDFRTYFRFLYLAFFRWREVHFEMTPKRALGLACFFLLFPLFELFTALCLLLDHVFFPGFRRVELRTPLFIVGPHRSGTTYLQRLLAKDDQFFCFRLWEIAFPSILQKKFLALVGRADRAWGGPLREAIRRREARRMGRYYSDIHELSFFQPEEDDKLSLHTFSTLALMWFVHPKELDWLLHFDRLCPPRDKARIMQFYRGCVQRQAYYKGGNRIFLSKAPFHSLRIGSIYEYFPGCRVVYTLRNPMTAIPSMLDVARKYWEATSGLKDWTSHQQRLYDTIREMYRYPLARLAEADPATCEVVVHDHLLLRPRDTIRGLYEKFGYTISTEFDGMLQAEDEKQRAFKSKHKTSLDQFGLTREQVMKDYADVYAAYSFEMGNP